MAGAKEKLVAADPHHISVAGVVYPSDREELYHSVAETFIDDQGNQTIVVERHPEQVDAFGRSLDPTRDVRLIIGNINEDPNLDPFWRAVIKAENRRESPNQNDSTHE